jgi:hypothetical protein
VHDGEPLALRKRGERSRRAADLANAGQENEDVARAFREHRCHRSGNCSIELALTGRSGVANRDRMAAADTRDHRGVAEEACERLRIQRCRHRNDAQPRARIELHLARHGQRQIGIQAALVNLVEHQCADAVEKRIFLNAPQEDAVSHCDQPRARRRFMVEANVVAHLVSAERDAALARDAPRGRARGHAPRLEQEHAARHRAGIEQCGRHSHRLAGARSVHGAPGLASASVSRRFR